MNANPWRLYRRVKVVGDAMWNDHTGTIVALFPATGLVTIKLDQTQGGDDRMTFDWRELILIETDFELERCK